MPLIALRLGSSYCFKEPDRVFPHLYKSFGKRLPLSMVCWSSVMHQGDRGHDSYCLMMQTVRMII